MLATGGGARYLPPQAATASRSAIIIFIDFLLCSEAGTRGDRERESGQRVLEEVFEGAVVEQVLRLEIEPERPDGPHADAGIEQQLGREQGGVVIVARHRRGEA